jgi:YbgC/YbaW family acyl-CoA thioester hydrolase
MSKVFTRTFRVRWSEVDETGWVAVAHYLRYLVETALDWGAAGHLSMDDIGALGQVWVIRETDLTFYRPLQYNDRFDFTIWLVQWRRVRGTRAFELTHHDSGKVIAQGVQQVVSLDARTLRPTSAPDYLREYFKIDHPRTFPQQPFPRVPPAPQAAFVMQWQVEKQDIDHDAIVNNAVYVDYAEEAAARLLDGAGWSPDRLKGEGLAVRPRRLHIQYQAPAIWGDRLRLATHLLELGDQGWTQYVAIQRDRDGTGIVECLLEWQVLDRASGQVQPVPAPLAHALQLRISDTDNTRSGGGSTTP